MAKKKRVEIPLLQITPEQERGVKDVMSRMRGNYNSDSLSETGRPHESELDAHNEKSGRPHNHEVDAHTNPVDAKTPTFPALVDAKTPTMKKVDAHNEKSGRPQNDRHRAGKTRIHFRMDDEQARAIKVFCAGKGIELQEFFILAGVHFLEAVDAHKKLLVDAKTPHDDLMIWKTSDDIIKRYAEMTGNKWKVADDRLGVQFSTVDVQIVEIGMITALIRVKLKRINSFKYFVPAILEAVEMVEQANLSGQSLVDYLKYARGKLVQMQKGK